jgi:hypothetical protein
VAKLEGLIANNGGQAVVVEMGEELRLLTLQVKTCRKVLSTIARSLRAKDVVVVWGGVYR